MKFSLPSIHAHPVSIPARRTGLPLSPGSRLVRAALPLLLIASLGWIFQPAACAQQTATLTTVYAFTGSNGAAGGPQSLLLSKDGNFYGTTSSGGSGLYGTIFKFTPSGQPTTIYNFTGNNDGGIPNPGLMQDDAGNFYGVTGQNGANNHGTVFKVTPAGVFTLVHAFTSQEGFAPPSALIRGADGNFYGVTGSNSLYQVTPAGVYTLLSISKNALSGPLVLGQDGNLYGVNNGNTVVRVSTSGAVTLVGTFTNRDQDPTTLIQGHDGSFYGTTTGAGFGGYGGTVFRVAADGTYTLLHQFDNPYTSEITSNSALLEGSNGNFYGAYSSGYINYDGTSNRTDYVYQITSGGVFTILHTFNGKDGFSPQGAGNVNGLAGAPLVAGSDGSLYGTTVSGGTGGAGTIFNIVLHPGFFTGEVALGQGVYYLAFLANGNIFGYFEYLSDPRFVYHFDLGFEYVFDAADGNSGVYFYDFKSGDFLYTSPTFPFPYLYDFSLNAFLYYYPDPTNPQRYNTNGVRYFFNFSTGKVITR